MVATYLCHFTASASPPTMHLSMMFLFQPLLTSCWLNMGYLSCPTYSLCMPCSQPCHSSHTCCTWRSQKSRWSWLLYSQQGTAITSWHWCWHWSDWVGQRRIPGWGSRQDNTWQEYYAGGRREVKLNSLSNHVATAWAQQTNTWPTPCLQCVAYYIV
jgi:hypothetical protein